MAGLANGIGLIKIRGSIILLAGLLIAVNVHANEDDFPSEERSAFEDQPSAFVLEDPYESFNRSMFSFNESADKSLIT